jgi:hypothetical protein
MRHVALGVNVGNLGRGRKTRESILVRCDRINRTLIRNDVDLRVITYYGHTGNPVLETTTLQPAGAGKALSDADGGVWMALSTEALRTAVLCVKNMPAPTSEHGVRWTPGLVFAVTKSAAVNIESSAKVCLRGISASIVAAWKRDRMTARGILDRTKREGGWGAVSAVVANQTEKRWTARSLKTLEGILDRCRRCGSRS